MIALDSITASVLSVQTVRFLVVKISFMPLIDIFRYLTDEWEV